MHWKWTQKRSNNKIRKKNKKSSINKVFMYTMTYQGIRRQEGNKNEI